MTPAQVEAFFTHKRQGYRFARWGRPIVPVVFGLEEETLRIVKGAIEAVVATAGHKMSDHDPEIAANLMMFCFRDWSELLDVPNLRQLIPQLDDFVQERIEDGSSISRVFRFDDHGAIQLSILFLQITETLARAPAEMLMLDQAARSMLTWGTGDVLVEGSTLRKDVTAILKAAYDPVMPASATDPSHALRLAARINA